jgi:transposase
VVGWRTGLRTDAKVCVCMPGRGRRKAVETAVTFGLMTAQILDLRQHLIERQVACVVMEATGRLLEAVLLLARRLPGVEVMLVHARNVKNLPWRKTGVGDAT